MKQLPPIRSFFFATRSMSNEKYRNISRLLAAFCTNNLQYKLKLVLCVLELFEGKVRFT